jgi:hypothetical protein
VKSTRKKVVVFCATAALGAVVFGLYQLLDAANVAIDTNISATNETSNNASPQVVFVSNTIGYVFFVDSGGDCRVASTTNAGVTWSAAVRIDTMNTNDCIHVSVWYDRWTPGDSGNIIHISTIDTSSDDMYYTQLNTSNNATSTTIIATTQTGTSFTAALNLPTITKATNGALYMAVTETGDSWVVTCTTTCTSSVNWTEITNPFDLQDDWPLLMPLAGGNIMLIRMDIAEGGSQNYDYNIWNGSVWSGWSVISGVTTGENGTYDGHFGATVNPVNNDIYFVYVTDNSTLGTDDDIRTGIYSGGSWSTTTAAVLLNDTKGILGAKIAYNPETGDIYVVYGARVTAGTAGTGNIFWKKSTTTMTSWGPEHLLTTASSDIYGSGNVNILASSTVRLYTTWRNVGLVDQFGDSVIDDVTVSSLGTQTTGLDIPSTNQYVGGAFVLTENVATSVVSTIKVTEQGTVDAQNDLSNIKLFYDLDTTAPYNCASESYSGSETQFSSTVTGGFTSANGTATFSGGSVTISTTSTMCVYTVLDVDATASNAETLEIQITNPGTDVQLADGSVEPNTSVAISGATTLRDDVLTQVHYHFRNDNGSEADATSATNGAEDTPKANMIKLAPMRLRIEVNNAGGTSSASTEYRLEYASKNVTCAASSGWTDVEAVGGAFDMFNSLNLTDGSDTTNIAVATGGTSNANVTFKTPNGGQKDTSSQTSGVVLTESQYIEIEYSIEATASASAGTSYCFRVTDAGIELPTYSLYPEVSINPNKDFYIQRGVTTISGTSATITAGSDYIAPSASTTAFIRITNTQLTGAGTDSGGGTQNASDVTAYISDPSNILSSITFTRAGSVGNTRVAWEIIEYIGPVNGDNEIVVRGQGVSTFGTSALAASSTVNNVSDASDVVVFVTGIGNPDTGTSDYNTGLVTGRWNSGTSEAVFERGETGSDAVNTSFAVVEFKGRNWQIQRVEHTYINAGSQESIGITPVISLSQAFIHTQKRAGSGLDTIANFGQEVWLNSTGSVTFSLDSAATSPANHVGVAWVIENTQTSGSPMVVTRSSGTQSGGGTPAASNIDIGITLSDLTIASIFTNNRVSNSTTAFPRAMMAVRIISTTQYELWVSDSGETRTYRTEVVEWPTAVQTIAQNYYRFYVDNNALLPTDAWPAGGTNLGENTSITDTDVPLEVNDNIRIRMSLKVSGATLAASANTFKLQFGRRDTSCSVITSWFDIGEVGSTTAEWRAVNNTPSAGTPLSGNPPTGGDLLLSVADRAGTYEEGNPSASNPYRIYVSEDVEYDWVLENHSAPDRSTYCFRMVLGNGAVLDTYNFYPTLVTAGFVPRTQNWRWYDDENNETPSSALADENTAPIDIENTNILKLRITAQEISGHTGQDVKFKLQFSRYSDFSAEVADVVATSTCTDNSLWCYADAAGIDNATVTAKVLSDVDACSLGVGNGCGTHNESSSMPSTFVQQANAATEYEFTIQHAGARTNTTYFFRLYDAVQDAAIEINTGETYPSLSTEGSNLSSSISGLSSGTVTEGVTTDITTTPTSVPFGVLPIGSARTAAYRFNVSTNATQGYTIYINQDQGLLASHGGEILPVTGTNASPSSWASGCPSTAIGCFGYHTGDDTLSANSTRFLANDTFAQFETTPQEVAYSSVPVVNEAIDFIFKIFVSSLQAAGSYQNSIQYIVVPVF